MSESIYRELQKKLDQYSIGFPITDSGIEIRILKYLFTVEDAKLFQALDHQLETAESIAKRVSQPLSEIAENLETMTAKGLLFRQIKNQNKKYAAIPFVHGIFEFQVKNLSREFAEMVGEYFEEAFDNAMLESADYFLRTVPINESIESSQNIAAFDDAVEILKSKSKIVVTDCICRKRAEAVEEGCGKPMEACFMFGSMGQYYLDKNIGRAVSTEEAIKLLKECQEAGLVTQPATAQNPAGLCNCCGDCCGLLRSLKMHPKPAEMVFSNYVARVDSDECTACEECLDRCQMDAITINNDDSAEIDKERCIGCGLCVTRCATEAINLQPKPEGYRTPPASTFEQMALMAQKRGLTP